ncbi:Oligopeptide transport ATP-binding protein OppD [compost metagenome]
MEPALLTMQDMEVTFTVGRTRYPALNNVSLQIRRGEVLGIVGESGCGKSLTSLSIMGLLPDTAQMTHGQLHLGDRNLGGLTEEAWQMIRGKQISMIFQDPMTALNPLMQVGKQIAETLRTHTRVPTAEARQAALDIMRLVGLSRVEQLYDEYPHRLSGGMRQRIIIAMALICKPQLLIADEPTTALDVTIQAQILDLLRELNRETGTAILLISHDLGVIREICQRVIVMYAGYVVEDAPTEVIIRSPKHPYTQGLLQSLPDVAKRNQALYTIPGRVPPLDGRGPGCPFAGRCQHATPMCKTTVPPLEEAADGHQVRCHLYGEQG